MKRGGAFLRVVLVVLMACMIAGSVSALNSSVGTFKKLAGQNWTVDGYDMAIIQREDMDEDYIYVRFGDTTKDMHLHDCTHIDNYRICFTNTTLDAAFNKTLMATPYTYWLKITADIAKVSITTTVEPRTLYVGETTDARISIRNVGSVAITDLVFTVNTAGFDVVALTGPCERDETSLVYTGTLLEQTTITCSVTMRSVNATKLVVRGVANYSDGRKNVLTLGPGITIESKGSPMSVSFASRTGTIGQTVQGMINLNNTFSDSTATLKGTLSGTLPLSGTLEFQESVGAGKSISKPFSMNLTHTGNYTLRIKGTRSSVGEMASIEYSSTFRVLPPKLTLKTFGRHTVANGETASLSIEVENGAEVPLRNVSVRVHSQNATLPPGGFPLDLDPGQNEQFYSHDMTIPGNDTTVFVAIELSYVSDYGETFTQYDNVTLTAGTPSRRPSKAPADLVVVNKTSTSTVSKPAAVKPIREPVAADAETPLFTPTTANIVLAVAIAAILIGCTAWLLSQRGKPPAYENVYDEEES